MSAPPPRSFGRGLESAAPIAATSREKHRQTTKPWWRMDLAFSSCPAPMYWAACTVKPVQQARRSPPKSQVLEATRPMDADAEAPRLPTIEESMYSMTTSVICARIAGMESCMIRRSCSPPVRGSPFRRRSSSRFCFMFEYPFCHRPKPERKWYRKPPHGTTDKAGGMSLPCIHDRPLCSAHFSVAIFMNQVQDSFWCHKKN